MFNTMRSIRKNTLENFEKYKQKSKIDIKKTSETASHCCRLVRKGINCGIIIELNSDLDETYSIIIKALDIAEIPTLSAGSGGILTKSGFYIRVFTKSTEMHAKLLLGDDAVILNAKDGDPRAKAMNFVLNL